ncbi:hypothetical protein [Anaerocellum diazotrophicum]|uniref:DUF4129 domain-containing protein n=1 Tax=Caldicellulosiruptor diazotrophicus TaxID=2806205 RepID=A0ABN6E9Z4_9FIRM|nr:hypothetical protein [Caldicellulosiruptor diazotrophicus]BCS82328.1 hypothetical protein CaldiYA01_22880 [Caldicellulosiruptor diazotrophicus]
MEKINQFITKYIYLFAITSLVFPIFIMFSSMVVQIDLSNVFLAFVVMDVLFLLIPYLIRAKSQGIWERILNILFIIVVPQGFALIVLKPYGFFEMFLGQVFCMGLYIYSYFMFEKEQVSLSLGAVLAGLWAIIIVGAVSSFMNIPKNITNQYTTYSIIFLVTSVYLINRVNLENLLSRRYRRKNSISSSISYINLFLSVGFIATLLLLFKFKWLAPYIVSFIVETIKFLMKIIKKILDFLNSLFATTKLQTDSKNGLEEFFKNMKPAKKTLISQILDFIGYILALSILGFLIYKMFGIFVNILKQMIANFLLFLNSIAGKVQIEEQTQNYTDVKTFIFAKKLNNQKLKNVKPKKIHFEKINDLNLRLRIIFKLTMEYFYHRKNYVLKSSYTPLEMGKTISKGELSNANVVNKLVEEYNKVRYNRKYRVASTENFERFLKNLK